MKNKKFSNGIACTVFTVCLSVLAATQAGRDDSNWFDAYVDELFLEEVAENTINLHYTLAFPENYGISEYEVSAGNYSIEDMKKAHVMQEEIRKQLITCNVASLTQEQKLTYDVLLDFVETELAAKDLLLYEEVLSPIGGIQAEFPVVLAEYTFRSKRDIEDYLLLVSQVDEVFDEVIAFEEEKSKAGLFMADYAADAVIAQCGEFIAYPDDNYMLDVFEDKIDAFDGLSDEEKRVYKEQHYEIITTEVVEAYENLIDGLEELKGTGTNELGLCYYEDGKEYYEYLVRTSAGTDASIDELIGRTNREIGERLNEISVTAKEHPEAVQKLADYSFPLSEPKEILDDLIEKIKEDFPSPPDVNYTIKYVHPSMQESMSPAFYLKTPVDDISQNLIYMNEMYLYSGENLYTTLAHEGYPGHLYQNISTQSYERPLIRNLISYPGYSEGWATYVEFEYGYPYAGLDEELTELLVDNQMATLGIYARVDLGVHYEGWDRGKTAEYLEVFGITNEAVVDEMFEMIVEQPANYLKYFIGYTEFMMLREEAEEMLGQEFEPVEFHQFLMEIGPAPFYIIDDYMEEWVEGYGK